jgi:lysophospholipase
MVTMIDPAFVRHAIPAGATVGNVALRDGWKLRAFDWAQPGSAARGSILFQGGRGDFFEKYLETFAHWHAQGWHVSAFDWRGQGGSGRLSANPDVGHCDDFALWIDDLAEVFADWRKDLPGPHIIMGHSMGGHLVLRALVEHRIEPDAAIAIAPMMGFAASPLPQPIATVVARWLAKLRGPNKHAWPVNERPSSPWASRQRLLTHDDARYADELWWHKERPDLKLGPPSWGWVNAANQSMALTDAAGAADGITLPVLIVGTEGDKLVSSAAIKRFASRLQNGTLKMFGKDVAHEILRERDGPRGEALAVIEAFLDRLPTQETAKRA